MRRYRRSKGMTLIEAVVSISILALVSTALVSIIVQSIRGWSTGSTQDNSTSSTTLAMQKLSTQIRDGRLATFTSGVLTVYYPRKVTDSVTQETIYDLSATDPYPRVFKVLNGNLVCVYKSATTVLAYGVSSLTFENDAYNSGALGGTVNVTIESSGETGTGKVTKRLKGRISLRNYKI